jgi:hypothetical protein
MGCERGVGAFTRLSSPWRIVTVLPLRVMGLEGRYAFNSCVSADLILLFHGLMSNRTYPRINVYLSEVFVSLEPTEYYQEVLKRRRVPLQSQGDMTLSRTRNLYQYPQLQK